MKNIKLLALALLLSSSAYSLDNPNNKYEINQIINLFMESLVKKDSIIFYSLFHTSPVKWIGIYKEKSQKNRLILDNKSSDYFTDNYKDFFRSLLNKDKYEEKFNNIKIIEDDYIASVSFGYSFWINGKMFNYGSEHWGLIKTNGKWKIVSVIFSIELT